MDTQLFVQEQIVLLVSACAAAYVMLRLLFGSYITGAADPLHLYVIYISCGLSLISYALVEENENLAYLYLCAVIFLLACGMGMRRYTWSKRSVVLNTNVTFFGVKTIYIRVLLFLVILAYLLYLQVIISSGVLSSLGGTVIDDRYQIFSANRFAFYLFSAAQFMPPVLLHALQVANNNQPRHKLLKIPLLGFCWAVQLMTFSKTALLFPLMCYAISTTLRRHDGTFERQRLSSQLASLGTIGTVGILVFLVTTAVSGEISIQSVLLAMATRLFTSFDALLILSTTDLSHLPNLSLFQFYLAPVLKVLGLYSQNYNAANYFIATEVMHFSVDNVGLLPNNNFVMEVFLCFAPWSRIPATILGGFLYGYLYRYFLTHRYSGPYKLTMFAMFIATPLGLLIDGQGWFAAVIAAHVIYVVARILSMLLTRQVVVRDDWQVITES